jgi:hypothetical protein
MAIFPIKPAITYGHPAYVSAEALQANSQAFLAGAPLVASTGKLAEGGAAPTAIVGFSAHQAGPDGSKVRYYPATPQHVFEGTFRNGAAAVALTQTDLFVAYGLLKAANDVWVVDKNQTTTAARVTIVAFRSEDEIGKEDARVLFVVHNDQMLSAT